MEILTTFNTPPQGSNAEEQGFTKQEKQVIIDECKKEQERLKASGVAINWNTGECHFAGKSEAKEQSGYATISNANQKRLDEFGIIDTGNGVLDMNHLIEVDNITRKEVIIQDDIINKNFNLSLGGKLTVAVSSDGYITLTLTHNTQEIKKTYKKHLTSVS